MEDIVKLITDNGIGIVCVAYFIYFQAKVIPDLTKELIDKFANVLNEINTRIGKIEAKLDIEEDKKDGEADV